MNEPPIKLGDIAATSLATLYCRALESASAGPIISDPMAVELTRQLTPLLRRSEVALHRRLAAGRVDRQLSIYVSLRAKRFDAYAADFIRRFPDGVLVNLGCGFDTRFHRIDEGRLMLFDLDLPEVIRIKRQLLPETDRYRFIAASVLDPAWMEDLPHGKRPVLFLAEGHFMYLPADGVKSLVLGLQANFPGSELVAEVFNTSWLRPWLKWSIDLKLRRGLRFGHEATFRSGLRTSRDMEQWRAGIEFLDGWCALDEPEPKLGVVRWLRFFASFRKVQWVVHYRLNPCL